jgi:hypothetical protein
MLRHAVAALALASVAMTHAAFAASAQADAAMRVSLTLAATCTLAAPIPAGAVEATCADYATPIVRVEATGFADRLAFDDTAPAADGPRVVSVVY